jgi:DNA-binding beta-propeller fold protein YncE
MGGAETDRMIVIATRRAACCWALVRAANMPLSSRPFEPVRHSNARSGRVAAMLINATRRHIAVFVAVVLSGPAYAAGVKQIGSIAIPGVPLTNFGVMSIDQSSGLGFLADKDNKGVVVFDTKTDKFVTRIPGFAGVKPDGLMSGPNGVVAVNGELWASDGDSTIKVIDIKSGKITGTIATGGRLRANGMAFDPKTQVVIAANSNEEVPFLSLISAQPGHKILAKLPLSDSGENIERSSAHPSNGMFYTALPVLRSNRNYGGLVQTDIEKKTVTVHRLENCHPHSLQVVSPTKIFLGCSDDHGPNAEPGGNLAVFDIPAGKVTSYGQGLGGNGGSAKNARLGLYYHPGLAELKILDTKTNGLVQRIPTSEGARSMDVNVASGKIYLATNAKGGPCGGCIQVYAEQ